MNCLLSYFFYSQNTSTFLVKEEKKKNLIKNVFNKILDRAICGVDSVKALWKPANFIVHLKQESSNQVFKDTKYSELKFDEALTSYRNDVEENLKQGPLKEEYKKIARKIMEQSMLPQAAKIMTRYLPTNHFNDSLSNQLQLDRIAIEKNAHKAEQGILNKQGLKLCGELGVFFDPHMNGNLPFLIGTRDINGSKVKVLRHAVPTIETVRVKVSEEYKAFLEDCKSRKSKILYCCLLNPNKIREMKLIRILHDIGSKYKDVFSFIRIPLDGILSKVDNDESLDIYRKKIELDIFNEINSPFTLKNEFIFGSKEIVEIVRENYKNISVFSYNCIVDVYRKKEDLLKNNPKELKFLLKEKKQAFMMLFSSVLRSVLIEKLKINYYGNVCKDAIDRASAHLTSDLIWDQFLTGDLKTESFKGRISASWPAFMAKTQPVIKSRADWGVSFVKWAESALTLGFRPRILKDYDKLLNIHVDKKVSFLDMFKDYWLK